MFTKYPPLGADQVVLLVDGTPLQTSVIGTVDILVDTNHIRLHNVLHVLGLVAPLYSIRKHVDKQG